MIDLKNRIFVLESTAYQKLSEHSKNAQKKRARICAHNGVDAALHEMFIMLKKNSYVRPHRHHNKSESIHIVCGTLEVLFFDNSGAIQKRIELSGDSNSSTYYIRYEGAIWHSVLVKSEEALFHETTNGPFKPEDTEYAEWAPIDSDNAKVIRYMETLRAES